MLNRITTPTTQAGTALITSKQKQHKTNMALTFRHTVEFSKNKHTPSRTTNRGPIQGNLFRVHGPRGDVNSEDQAPSRPSRGRPRGAPRLPVTYGLLPPVSAWLPCDTNKATEQRRSMSIVSPCARHRFR